MFYKYIYILFFSFVLSQDRASINGFVRNDGTGEPVSYANVYISNTNSGTATNSDG